jgi:phosphonate C-P lyase system protein PhnG
MSRPDDLRVDQAEYLGILSYAPPEAVMAFVADILPAVGSIDVLHTHTGLLTLSTPELVAGSYEAAEEPAVLGEVLVTETSVQLDDGTIGYSACLGRDVLQAVAVAILDAVLMSGLPRALKAQILDFVDEQAKLLAQEDDESRMSQELVPA